MASQSLPGSITTAAASSAVAANFFGITKVLVQKNVIDEKKGLDLQARAASEKASVLQLLAKENKSLSKMAAVEIARAFELPLTDLDQLDHEQFPAQALADVKKIEELRAIPLFVRGPKMFIAVSDPTTQAGLNFFTHKENKRIELVIVDDFQISALVASMTGAAEALNDLEGEDEFDFGLDTGTPLPDDSEVAETGEDNPVVNMVSTLLHRAIKKGASDIHFEPYEKIYRIRFRVDGVLKEVLRPPISYGKYIASRIKVISLLNIAEKRVPQDGRMKLKVGGGKSIDFRVSTMPTMYGEKIVMRILDPSAAQLGIEALGYENEEKSRLLEAIARPYGMVLVTGPTGSGKTVSLYTCLNILNNEERNISTAEDPCEIQMTGINQVNVNVAQGLTFASALKSFLRQDPDIIMVGEIRDEETAEISVKAAQTGHLVLSTLHTNDAPKTISRLIEIGVKPYNVADAISLITAQRLARKLCPHCKQPDKPLPTKLLSIGMTQAEVSELNVSWKPFKALPEGCDMCTNGYKGRVGIYQVMPISPAIQRIIIDGGDSMLIAKQAKEEGVRDLRQSALVKYRQGLTSIDEVISVTNE